MKNKIIGIVILLFLVSCRDNQSVDVVGIRYNFDNEFFRDDLELEIVENKSEVKFTYWETMDSIRGYQQAITMFPATDSIILYHSDTAHLVDQKIYGNDTIKRYYYNTTDISDDELLLFTLENIGLVGFVELAWDGYMIMDHPATDIEEKLRVDDSGFFYRRKK